MTAISPRAARLASAAVVATTVLAAISGCGNLNIADPSRRIADSITPYRIEVVQGNLVTREQVEAVKPGMSRAQVKDILGSPLLASVFHENRWDYVFTLQRQGVPPQQRRLTAWFKGDELDRVEGDTMPSEAEFVATLDNRRKGQKVPNLEASEEALRRFDDQRAAKPAAPAATTTAPAAPAAPAATAYPPLETTAPAAR